MSKSMNILFLFLDGIGLGMNDPDTNPFARVEMPVLHRLLGERRFLAENTPLENERSTLLALDACLGVPGLPQSATGQAVLLTGVNVPAILGYHYGPKPNPEVAEFIRNGNLFRRLKDAGRSVAFLDAYPPGYFASIASGRRLYSAIPLAATSAQVALRTADDLKNGEALSADFTAQGWRENLGLSDTPLLSPNQAGKRLARLAQAYNFSLFEYWLSDYSGHKQDMQAAVGLLETFDQVLGGLLDSWDDKHGLILLTSDHGNMEDMSIRRHTANPVPLMLVGAPALRQAFVAGLGAGAHDLTGIAPAIFHSLAPAPFSHG